MREPGLRASMRFVGRVAGFAPEWEEPLIHVASVDVLQSSFVSILRSSSSFILSFNFFGWLGPVPFSPFLSDIPRVL